MSRLLKIFKEFLRKVIGLQVSILFITNTSEKNGRAIYLLKKKTKPQKERKKPKVFELSEDPIGKFVL